MMRNSDLLEASLPVLLADELDELVVDVRALGLEEARAGTQLVEEEQVLKSDGEQDCQTEQLIASRTELMLAATIVPRQSLLQDCTASTRKSQTRKFMVAIMAARAVPRS